MLLASGLCIVKLDLIAVCDHFCDRALGPLGVSVVVDLPLLPGIKVVVIAVLASHKVVHLLLELRLLLVKLALHQVRVGLVLDVLQISKLFGLGELQIGILN